MYEIPYNVCQTSYIGAPGRLFYTRMQEHQDGVEWKTQATVLRRWGRVEDTSHNATKMG